MPDTSEANDEMCAPSAPKISEMCSLKPFSCCWCLAEKTKTGFASNRFICNSDEGDNNNDDDDNNNDNDDDDDDDNDGDNDDDD